MPDSPDRRADEAQPPRSAHRLPPARARHLGPEDAQRVTALLTDGTHAVASAAALVLVDDSGIVQRVEWHEIDHASFDAERRTLTVRFTDGAREPLELVTAGPRGADVITAVRERVEASVIHQEQTMVADGTRVRVALRRDGDGRVFTQVTTLGSPTLTERDMARIEDLTRRVRATIGLTEDDAL